MTWAEFKASVEKAGVQDSDDIAYIDVGMFSGGVEAHRDGPCWRRVCCMPRL